MIQASILAVLTLTGHVAVWHLFVLGAFLGLINAFDMPARQSFVIDMVGQQKEDLANAIALNSILVNGARLAGPVLAGLAVAAFGEGICFLLNALSFLAIVVALLSMSIEPEGTQRLRRRPPERSGRRLPLRLRLPAHTVRAHCARSRKPHGHVLPGAHARLCEGRAPWRSFDAGLSLAAAGVGALVSAAALASRKSVSGIERFIVLGSALFGFGLAAFPFPVMFGFSLVAMFFSGFGMMTALTSCNTMLQTVVDEDKRGRVMSFYAMAFQGMTPFGNLLAGSLASHIGGAEHRIGRRHMLRRHIRFGHEKLPVIRKAAAFEEARGCPGGS